MVLNEEKKKKLVELVAKRKAAAAGVGTSTPANPPPPTTYTPNSLEPAPVDNRMKGVMVVATGSEDEDTCTGLFFKRPRMGDVEAPSHSTSDGHAPSFRENPLIASSPRDLIMHEGGGESACEGHKAPPAVELPAILQQALKCFQNKEVVESLGEDLL